MALRFYMKHFWNNFRNSWLFLGLYCPVYSKPRCTCTSSCQSKVFVPKNRFRLWNWILHVPCNQIKMWPLWHFLHPTVCHRSVIVNRNSVSTAAAEFRKLENASVLSKVFLNAYYRPIPFGSESSLPLFFLLLTRALSLPFLSSHSR